MIVNSYLIIMKKVYLISLSILAFSAANAQNVGVDVATPQQKLDVAGAIKIGSTSTGVAGSLRWTGSVFQFHDGTQWITLNANTDDQVLDVIQLNGTDLEISIENDGQATHAIDLSSFLDNTDAQQFDAVSINGSNQLLLSISNDGQATHVLDLSGYLDNTDEQQFDIVQLSGTNLELSLQNDGLATHVIDLSSLAVDTDDQTIDVLSLTGNTLNVSLEDDGQAPQTLDLSQFMDNTDDQQFDVINITSDQLRLSLEADGQATHVLDLTPYKDNTDNQIFDVIQLVGTDLQLSLEDDGQATHSIDLSGFADNTDDQTIDVLTMSGNTLNISLEDDGQATQTLDLSQFADNTDDQAVTTFNLNGTNLELQVESDAGGLQTVDLSPLQTGLVDDDGDTKVEVEATADEDQIRLTTAGGEAMRINATQQVGIGLSTGIQNKLVVQGSNSDTRSVLGLRGGNAQNTFADGAQIAFGYDSDDAYQHFIHTRHNSAGGSTNNSIDFYVSDGTQYNTVTSGSTHVMSLNSGNVGIGVTAPTQKLDVIGNARVSGLGGGGTRLVVTDNNGLLTPATSVPAGMGDNLGNHTATTTLNMSDNEIDNINYLDMRAGNGYGLRFWSDNNYKISMGNSAEYRYGDVQDYSIKMNMNNDTEQDRGWTWGVNGQTPVASLSGGGHFTLDGALYLDCINCGSTSDPYPTAGSGWGDMVIQGRVMSTNSNLHLSPPGGSNVVIDDTYRAGGGSSSAAGAGLQVERLAGGGNRVVMADNSGILYGTTDVPDGDAGYIQNQYGGVQSAEFDVSGRGRVGRLTFQGEGGNSGNPAASYAIFQEAGNWSFPYPDLRVAFHTGIKIGAHFSYNGTRFYNNSDMATEIFSVGNGDNYVRSLYGHYSPIYWDYNDSGYYTDHNSTSREAQRMRGGTLYGPNLSWGRYLSVGANGREWVDDAVVASIATTNGNIHVDAASGYDMYLNYYDGNQIHFGRGNNTDRALMNGNGLYLYDGWFRHYGQQGLYSETYGNHFYPSSSSYWDLDSDRGLILRGAGHNSTIRGYLYHDGGDSYGLLDRDGSWAVRTVRDQYVELRDNDEVMFRAGAGGVNGDYGSVSTYGGGKNGWEGYNINDRYVFMSSDVNSMGLYNDVDNRWVMYHQRNDRVDFYEPDGGAVSFRIDNNENQMFRGLRMYDNDIWDVERLTVNTIYDEEDTRVDIIDDMRWDVPGSGQDVYLTSYAGHPSFRPGSAQWGFIGNVTNWWLDSWVLREYRNQEYGFSDRRVKQNIRYLEGQSSLDKIMKLNGALYDLNPETHPMIRDNADDHEIKDNLGFIAQELKEVIPEMVVYHEESGFYLVKNYEQMFPVVVEAMKEQQRQIEELKQLKTGQSSDEVSALKTEVEELRELVRQLLEDK